MRTRERNRPTQTVRSRTTHATATWALTLALSVMSTACASARTDSPFSSTGTQPRSPSPSTADLSIEVRNQHLLAVHVWVQWPGERRFLGDVPAGTANTFRVPATMAHRFDSLRLYADPVGSVDDVLTGPIKIGHGHRIEWRLEKVLANSRARVM